MAKLVVLSAGMTGRTHELNVEKTTIGRVEDNIFQIAEPSVSSHHCEILVREKEVLVRDLNSTNGTYINGEKITESVLKPGQVLRLGQIEMRLDGNGPAPAPAAPGVPATAPAPAPSPPAKKGLDPTMTMQRGVSLNELEQGRAGGFDTASKGFSKKQNKTNKVFIIVGVFVGIIIVFLLLYGLLIVRR